MKQLTDKLEKLATDQLMTDNLAKCQVLELTRDGLEAIIELEGQDTYELIQKIKRETPNKKPPFAIVLTCSGWAVDIKETKDTDTPPSKHPNRIRVAVATSHSTIGQFSHVAFENGKHTTHGSETSGPLDEALNNALKHLTKKHKTEIKRTRPEA